MNVICVICSDLLLQSENIYYTPCGHVFHLHCLTQWIERSRSCPQCRKEVKNSGIHKLYFTSSNDEVATGDRSMQEKIDSLKFQVMLREKDIKYYVSKNNELQKQSVGLRKEVRKVESEINGKNSAIHALKEQIKYFKDQCAERDRLKSETIRLRNKIEDLRPIQVLLHEPIEDVQKMVGKTKDPDTLMTFISVMKKELIKTVRKCKEFRFTARRLEEKHCKEKMQLQKKLESAKSKNLPSKTLINELEEMLGITKANESQGELQDVQNTINISVESTLEGTSKDDKRDKSSKSSSLAKYKISKKTSTEFAEKSSSCKTRIRDSSSLEESLTELSDCPTPCKRPRLQTSQTEIPVKSSSSKSSDNKYYNHNTHSKNKKDRHNITTTENNISSNNLKTSNTAIIDLT